MKWFSVLSMIGIMMISGCSVAVTPTPQEMPKALSGDWQSTTSRATLRFENGKISGYDGCNRFSGTYTVKGNQISVADKMISTMMACPNSENATAFKDGLKAAKTYQNDGQTLVLQGSDSKPLIRLFFLSPTLKPDAYYVTHYNNGKGAVVSASKESLITLELDKSGKVIGSTGCNNYNSTYNANGSVITIGYPATTRKMCSPALMEQESAYTKALSRVHTITRNGESYELRDEFGGLQIALKVIIF